MTTLCSKIIATGITLMLAFGMTASPALAEGDGLSRGKIILAESKKKKPATTTTNTTTTTATCGNGKIEGNESCDGYDLSGKTCADFGKANPAGLACSVNCTFDTSGCQ
jgi:hypothetical protein